jgi:hydroxyethylthiazole kinase-like uncharacterized protein yjeF
MSNSEPTLVTPATLRGWALPEPAGGKEARGQLLVVGGSTGTPGAVRLAGESGLRAGAGKLALATASEAAAPLAIAVPEAQVVPLPTTAEGDISPHAAAEIIERADAADAILIGPGFVDPTSSSQLVAGTLSGIHGPVVLDATASAYLTDHQDGCHHFQGKVVLTVNPDELALTAGRARDDVATDPVRAALDVARRSRIVVLVGGTSKTIAGPDGRVWRIEGGGPGLGVSGSGDVQAGIVAGLLARGAEPAQAAVWGGYLHARCGERLAADVGPVGFLARQIPPHIPAVLSELS